MKNAHSQFPSIIPVILAAGLSKRMGEQKLLLDWEGKTVIETVVTALAEGGCPNIYIVTGASHHEISKIFSGKQEINLVYNENFAHCEMLQSLQVGVKALPKETKAFFIALGDQPQINSVTVAKLMDHFLKDDRKINIPSFNMKRGHPWLIPMEFAEEILNLPSEKTLRDFINAHAHEISYLNVETEDILKDLDTPEDYERDRPKQ